MLRNFFFWAIQCIQRGFDFKGRACRREVWSYAVFIGIINLLLSLIIGETLAGILMFILFIIPGISSCVKRLHDINLSGKWVFVFYGMIFAVYGYVIYIFIALGMMSDQYPGIENLSDEEIWQFMTQYMSDEVVNLLVLFGIHLVTSIVLLVLMLKRGTAGENKYGQPHDYIDRDRSILDKH
ncbi:DUF805 domain-containing protein [Commensalibacter nepenthis]|uniref:DUF805 domain-containing protein n=1 Tax=Commensalibacter nepenthis TaxID=3043872 RepID=A0ABT6Q992_9PROT|nr:DUF805 domain-containing protein [Commensalibacter sp. TBRC 10068]MDI2112875.1 DUF805 domain-containing protein [Commensalibacter sp. TBRC 10068]